MEYLGFSAEELDKINSQGKKKTVEFTPVLEPIPDLTSFKEEAKQKYLRTREAEASRLTHRHHNMNPQQISNEKQQSANLPKIQRFIKRMKTLSDDSQNEVTSELQSLSLKSFISEVAHSLSENKLQLKDFPLLIEVCSKLHQSYPEFQKNFELNLKKQHKEGDLLRKRNVLRFVAEMLAFGLWSDNAGACPKDQEIGNSLILISSVLKNRSEELLGVVTYSESQLRKSADSVPFKKAKALSDQESQQISKALKDFYAKSSQYVAELHKKCLSTEERNQKIKEELCVLDENKISELNNYKIELSKSREALVALSDILNESPPVFEEVVSQAVETEFKEVNFFEIFDSDDSREFYLNVLKMEEQEEHKRDPKGSFESIKKKFVQCNSKETADQLAEEFLRIANKKNRKELIDFMTTFSKNSQVLPYYARIIAAAGSQYKEIPCKVFSRLENEFLALQELGDPASFEIRSRNIKFIGELVKFQLVSPMSLFNCFDKCLSNFLGENIEICCVLLRSCGRYLVKHPESSERTNLMINRMVRLKEKMNLPLETVNMIDDVIFTCRPKEKLKKKKNSPVLFEFIKHQFLVLDAKNAQEIIKNLVKCPLPESEKFVIKAVFKAVKKGKIFNLGNICKVLAGMKNNVFFQETIMLLVDLLCEEILSDLKTNDFRRSQYRILLVKFFGELHCYNIIDYNLVFKMLFTLLNTPCDTFKVKLIWALLDSVKDVFTSVQYKEILKKFLTDFKSYILTKPGISIEMEFLVMDLLEMFRTQKVKPGQIENVKKEAAPEFEETKEDPAGTEESDEEMMFGEEYQKFVDEEIYRARNTEVARGKEIPTIYNDRNSEGFKVLMKKAGKVQAKNIVLPNSHPLVKSSEERSRAQAAEREKLSKVVIGLEQRRMMEENK